MWYNNSYLPNAVGVAYWGPTIRPYNLPTDKFLIGKEMKMYVTPAGEAFGLIQYENSRDRWLAILKWRREHPGEKWSYSKNKEETHQFKSKWSDYSHGQGSGWEPAVIDVYNARQAAIRAFREADLENGNAKMEFGKTLIRLHLGVTGEVYEPANKKLKQVEVGDEEPPPPTKVTVMED